MDTKTLTLALAIPLVPLLAPTQAPEAGGVAPTGLRTPAATAEAPAAFYWADYDADGLADAYAVQPDGTARLLHNTGDGFEDVTGASGLAQPLPSRAAWHDVDGDGALDLFLFAEDATAALYRGDGAGFVDWTASSGLDGLAGLTNAAFVDADGDGRDDLHVVGASGHAIFKSIAGGAFVALPLPTSTGAASTVMRGIAGFGPILLADTHGSGRDLSAARTPAGATTQPLVGVTGSGISGGGGVEYVGSGFETLFCPPALADQAGGSCIEASSVPTYGMLYPLGDDFFVEAGTGFVGVGTTAPSHLVTIDGSSSSTDELRYWAPGSSSGYVALSSPGGFPGIIGRTNNDMFNHTIAFANDSIVLNPKGGNAEFEVNNDGQVDFWAPEKGNRVSHINHGTDGSWYIRSASTAGNVYLQDNGGKVGVGTTSPGAKLDVSGSLWISGTDQNALPTSAGAGIRIFNDVQTGKSQIYAYDYASDLGLDLYLGYAGTTTSVSVLEIRGGADLVEGFETSGGSVLEPGTVVVIDPESPGALTVSTTPYDSKVAGVVSGAGGVQPGIHLGQDGLLDGDTEVAMTGRVYVKASTEGGAIRPGDRLTTASLAGHAMKASDTARSDGAVLGKAMTALDEGTGLVLVLVNLQ